MEKYNLLEADIERLYRFAEDNKDTYANAEPFSHTAIEDFVYPHILEGVLEELESNQEGEKWNKMDDRYQNKWSCSSTLRMGVKTRNLIQYLNSQEMLTFLEKLTGIEGLVPDPYLAGGGLHELRDGGYLGVHADFNYQKQIRLDRRINLILYFNKDWEEDFGGNLELWDTSMKSCVKKYTPDFNRCVIFNTTDNSFHGNPQPVKTPDGRTRRSIAMYYYTNGRPNNEVSSEHMTLFQYRPGEASISDSSKRFIRKCIPPILFEIFNGKKY
jgi:Rps23 Pro-64 3,4-dihydroxylase Tpa1-like proline 4-hydroxylase